MFLFSLIYISISYASEQNHTLATACLNNESPPALLSHKQHGRCPNPRLPPPSSTLLHCVVARARRCRQGRAVSWDGGSGALASFLQVVHAKLRLAMCWCWKATVKFQGWPVAPSLVGPHPWKASNLVGSQTVAGFGGGRQFLLTVASNSGPLDSYAMASVVG